MKSSRLDLRHLAGGDIGLFLRSGLAYPHVSLADVVITFAAIWIGASPWPALAAVLHFH